VASSSYQIAKLDKLMQNMGKGNFTYDLFKAAYDADPRLQKLVTNFDKLNIELKSSETDDVANLPGNPGRPGRYRRTNGKERG